MIGALEQLIAVVWDSLARRGTLRDTSEALKTSGAQDPWGRASFR